MLPTELVSKPQQVLHILWPKNLTKHLYTQSIQNLSSTETWHQNSVVTKVYAELGHKSNQQKAEFVDDIFHTQSFWGGHGKILLKTWFIQDGAICIEMLIQQPVEFPTVVTRKSLTVWSCLMEHQKSERVVYQNGIWDFQSLASPRLETEDPFCRYSVQKQNSAAMSIVKIL
jgi:hypothetical protein